MNNKHYELTDDTLENSEHILHRIRALRDIPERSIKKGDIGGFVESYDNLSDNAWVYDNAKVYENARVFGDAEVHGNAEVLGDAVVASNEDYAVFKNFWSSGRYFTWTRSNNMWRVGCFYGTGEELIAKAYKDSEESGKQYKRVVAYVNEILKEEE